MPFFTAISSGFDFSDVPRLVKLKKNIKTFTLNGLNKDKWGIYFNFNLMHLSVFSARSVCVGDTGGIRQQNNSNSRELDTTHRHREWEIRYFFWKF